MSCDAASVDFHSDAMATLGAPAHMHAKVTAHKIGFHIYIYGCVNTEVCVHHHDCG